MTEEITIDVQAAAAELLRLRRRVAELEIYSMLLEWKCGMRTIDPDVIASLIESGVIKN